jgi:hypothetical protein
MSVPRPGFKHMPCKHCGIMMEVGANRHKEPAHLECGIALAVEVSRQMREKSGPYYERWLNAMTQALDEAAGGGAPGN